jgi:acetylornithine/N-succinyldiaminopimelate aminotransferase
LRAARERVKTRAMPTNAKIIAIGNDVLLSNYRQAPVVLDHGKGCELWDVEGRRYLDLYGGIAVSALGHAHPALVHALQTQAAKLLHASNLVWNEPAVMLAQKLVGLTRPASGGPPVLSRAFLCNSGTEAMEACVKLARRHAFLKGETQRTRFVAFKNSFHGRSMGALPLTGTPKYWEGFGADLERVVHVDFGNLDQVRTYLEAHPREVCGIVVEPVQGEGGVLPAQPGFLAGLRALATEFGALLIVDEIQTGIGRTGRWFGYQHADIAPDMIPLAKGLGGGMPIGAMLVRESLNGVLGPGTHGTTFGGNPIACAAALAVLETMENDKLVERAAETGEYLSSKLREVAEKLPGVFDGERGVGLLRGLIMARGVEARQMLGAARDKGVLLSVASERVLRVTPPLVIDHATIDEAMLAIEAAAATITVPSPRDTQPSR